MTGNRTRVYCFLAHALSTRQTDHLPFLGTTSTDDALRHELEDIVRGLQDYLINVRQKADAQRLEFDNLLRDKERLVRKLAMLEQEKSMLIADADDYTQLQQQVNICFFTKRLKSDFIS